MTIAARKAAGRRRSGERAAGRTKNIVFHLDQLYASGKRTLGRIRKAALTSEGVLVNGTSGANAAIALTLAAVAGRRNGVKAIVLSYSAAPTGGRLTVTDAGATVLDIDITAAGPITIPLPDGIQSLAVNSALVFTLAAAGAAVVGKINLSTVLS